MENIFFQEAKITLLRFGISSENNLIFDNVLLILFLISNFIVLLLQCNEDKYKMSINIDLIRCITLLPHVAV